MWAGQENMMDSSSDLAFTFSGVAALEVEVLSGNVTLTPTTGPLVVALRPRGTNGADLAREFVVEQVGSTVRVIAPKGPRGLWGVFSKGSVDVEIQLSAEVSTRARTGSGAVAATGTLGPVDAGTGSGDIVLDVCASGALKTGSGDITVTRCDGELRAKTGSGDVRVGSCAGSLDIATGSGTVRIDRADGQVRAKTGSGDISVGASPGDLDAMTGMGTVRIESVLGGRNRLKTGSGDVVIGIARGVAALLDLHTVSGDVRNELDAADGPADADTRAEITVHCGSGDITLRRAGDANSRD